MKCFADKGDQCVALEKKDCDGCVFYKTKDQVKKERADCREWNREKGVPVGDKYAKAMKGVPAVITDKCKVCANRQKGDRCRSMERKPYPRWCFMTDKQAIEAEESVLKYIKSHPSDDLKMVKTLAYKRIEELEDKRC